MNQIIQQIEKEHINKISFLDKHSNLHVGDDIIVRIQIPTEGKSTSSRTQKFIGRLIGIKNRLSSACTFKVLKLEGTKVIRIFSLYSPLIEIDVKTQGHARRSKLNYLINRTGKSLRIKTKRVTLKSSLKNKSKN